MSQTVRKMTEGHPVHLMIVFALPLMAGNIFQQMYTILDTIVVGRFLGVEALAAVGAADWLNWMVLSSIVGFAQGFSIPIAQSFGAKDYEGLRKTLGASVILGAVLSILLLMVGQGITVPVLHLLETPDSILGMAVEYLRSLFWGIPVVMAYNIASAVLRSLGNSRTPLYAMIIASIINVVLDVVFVTVFHWGVRGAAIATVMAQFFAFLFCLAALRRIDFLSMSRKDFREGRTQFGKLLKLGSPLAFQNAIISIGGLVVQYVVNGFGVLFVAGFTATNKMYGILESAAISYGYAVTTYTGQNLGAGEYGRIKSGVRQAAVLAVITSAVISLLMFLFGRAILSLFISGTPEEVQQVLGIAYRYLMVMAAVLSVLYLLYVYRSALQGLGDTLLPMVSGIIELLMRISAALLLPRFIGQSGIYYAEVAAWTGAAIFLIISYLYRIRQLGK